jgi:hypothetical protein
VRIGAISRDRLVVGSATKMGEPFRHLDERPTNVQVGESAPTTTHGRRGHSSSGAAVRKTVPAQGSSSVRSAPARLASRAWCNL